MFPKFKEYNRRHLLYILTCILKFFEEYGYSTSMANVIDLEIELPYRLGKIDFEYIELIIKELEKLNIQDLELKKNRRILAYLEILGLENYEFTEKDILVLDEYKHLKDNSLDRQTDRQTDKDIENI